jgi:hypothetical protein
MENSHNLRPLRPNGVSASQPQADETAVRRRKKNWLYESLDFSRWVHHQTLIRHLPFVFFLSLIATGYIANVHFAEQNVREIAIIEKQLNELRWQYMTTKAELEHLRKQSEIATLVLPSGLKELREPPQKITVKEDER